MLLGPAGSWLFSVCNFVGCLNFNLGERGFGHKHGRSALYLSKWFYDTFTGAATGAARCGFFVGGAQIAQGVGYQGIRWTRGFTWFGPPERNTLRPRVNEVVLLCLSARLKSRGHFLCPSVRLKSLFSALGVCPDLL
jgi:hypothetical protein